MIIFLKCYVLGYEGTLGEMVTNSSPDFFHAEHMAQKPNGGGKKTCLLTLLVICVFSIGQIMRLLVEFTTVKTKFEDG